MGTNDNPPARPARGSASAASGPDGVPPRRWGRALLWMGLFAVLVVLALAVSFRADDRSRVLGRPPADQVAFCAAAAGFDAVSEIEVSEAGVGQMRSLRATALDVAALSPEPVAADLEAVADALDRVAVAIESVPDDDPEAIVVMAEALDRELGSVTEEADEAGVYIDRWCEPFVSDPGSPSTTA